MSPDFTALALGLGSGLALAASNAFVKAGGDILMSRAALSLAAALIVLPGVVLAPLPDAATWGMLALSVPAHWIYQATLVRALHRGDLSLVFPVMRGSAPLLTALGAMALLGERLSPVATLGLALAGVATLVFALPEGAAGSDPARRRAAILWALATGAGVAVYNVIDARGVRAAPTPITFIVWLFMLDSIGINAVAFWMRRETFARELKSRLRKGAVAGGLSVASFGLALYGFSVAPVSHISALRETSVVFAALLGWAFLGEGFGLRRTAAACGLAGGLALMLAG